MLDLFSKLSELGAPRAFFFSDPASGLRCVLVIDDVRLGPAAGGVRTRAYASVETALEDAASLARSMTLKCALGGLDAGGAKAVVMNHPGLDRKRAFRVLGRRVQELAGLFRTAGDLGTTADDLQQMALETEYVHTDEGGLAESVARGHLRCVEALAARRGREVAGLRVAVQGVGAVGAAVTRALVHAGAEVRVADLEPSRVCALAQELAVEVVSDPAALLMADVDVLAPCAVGQVIDTALAGRIHAWGVCGAANGVLASEDAGRVLHERGVLLVPDVVASAGAVVDGIGRSVMELEDRRPLIDQLGVLAGRILERSEIEDRPSTEVAEALAHERLDHSQREA